MLPPAEAIEGYLQLSRDERWFSNFGPCAELLRTRLAEAAGDRASSSRTQRSD